MAMIKDNIARLQDDISLICRKLGRSPEEITFVCVTKFASAPMIQEALDCRIRHVGENKVQEAIQKYSAFDFPAKKITRHMIGHLQTNKVADALKIFDVIQSVDSLKLAQTIDKNAQKLDKKIDTLIQVNASGEKQKFGIAETETLTLMSGMAQLKNLNVLGLMTVGPLTDEAEIIR